MTSLGLRWAKAMLSAESTKSAAMRSPMDQPTTRRLQTSMTTARYRNPVHVGT
jgi:hypothetical protein